MKRIPNAAHLLLGIFLIFHFNPLWGQSGESKPWMYTHQGDTLIGTKITVENSPGILLIVAGSGPTDRNGNNTMGLHTDAYKKLAESFADMGWSSVRYDKRGIAGSAAAATRESELLPSDYIDDIQGIILQLEKDHGLIVLVGHSEGAIHCGMALKNASLTYPFISLEGPGRSLDITLKEQLKTKLNADLYSRAEAKIDSIKKGYTAHDKHFIWQNLFRVSVQPYMRQLFTMVPCEIYPQLKGLVYVIDGGHDIQITDAERNQLAECLPQALFVTIPKMTHVLVNSESSNDTKVYNQPDLPISPELIKTLNTILNQRIPSGK